MAWPPFWAYLPSACRMMVDFPMPGSPPTRSAEPGTSPPPVTRSNSAMPVGRRSGGASSLFKSSRRDLAAFWRGGSLRCPGAARRLPPQWCSSRRRFALARPFGRGRAAGLAGKGGGGFGHDSEFTTAVKQGAKGSVFRGHLACGQVARHARRRPDDSSASPAGLRFSVAKRSWGRKQA